MLFFAGLFIGAGLGLVFGGMNRLSAEADTRARLRVIRGGVRKALRHETHGKLTLWHTDGTAA